MYGTEYGTFELSIVLATMEEEIEVVGSSFSKCSNMCSRFGYQTPSKLSFSVKIGFNRNIGPSDWMKIEEVEPSVTPGSIVTN